VHNFSLPLLLFGDIREDVDNENWIRKIVWIVVQTVVDEGSKEGSTLFFIIMLPERE
jgi:hypothetical protein